MKKFIMKLAILLLPIYFVVNIYLDYSQKYMIKAFGPSTQMQIEYSFKNALKNKYDCLILGNSRLYRGINPDKISIPTYNFSHDNDSFNQCYYKMLYLKKHHKKYKYLILGVDYTEFSYLSDSRNYIYNKYFDKEYRNDFKKDKQNDIIPIFHIIDDKSFNQYMNDKFSKTVPILISNVFPKLHIQENIKKNAGFIKENGQFILEGKAHKNDTIDRVYKRLPIQISYFRKILNFADEHDITVFLVMPPMRQGELKNFDKKTKREHKEFIENEIKNHKVYYIDYSESKYFKMEDYTDIAHLNSKAADRFTIMLNEYIDKVCN